MSRPLALAALLAAWGCATALAADRPVDPLTAGTLRSTIGAPVPLGTLLQDQDGRPVRLGELAGGRPLLLAPVYYRCPNLCGLNLAGLLQALDSTGLDPVKDYRLVVFSIDAREGPADAAASQAVHRAAGLPLPAATPFLVGTTKAVADVTASLGFSFAWDAATAQFAHPAVAAVMSPSGRVSAYVRGLDAQSDELRASLQAADQGRLQEFAERLAMLCFTYDPQTGRYTPRVIGVVQALGVGTATLMAAGIALALHRERRRRPAGGHP